MSMARRRVDPRAEQGQILPLLAVAMVAVIAVAVVLFQVGAAATLRTQSQTSADAAALAGGNEVVRQIKILMATTGGGVTPQMINQPLVCASAAAYAARNDGVLTACRMQVFDVLVTVRSRETLDAVDEDDGIRPDNERAVSKARAAIGVDYAFGLLNVGVGSGGGAGGPGGGGNCITSSELRSLEERAGVSARPDSALRRYCGAGTGGPADVRDLVPAMKVAILKAEDAMGAPIVVNSGYRTVEYQRVLCQRVDGPCAPPGASLHNAGMAIDVQNWPQLLAVAGRAGLCQPLPSNDAVHFSLASGPECAGRGGALGPGQRFGPGGLGSFATFEVRLVAYPGGL